MGLGAIAGGASLSLIAGGTALAVGGQIASYETQKHAADQARQQQEKANAIAQASSAVESARRRRRAIAEARIAEAQNVAAAGQTATTSALPALGSSLATQTQANIATARGQTASAQQMFDLRQQASNTLQQGQLDAGLYGAFGSIGQTGLYQYANMTRK